MFCTDEIKMQTQQHNPPRLQSLTTKDMNMAALEQTLIQKLQLLPPQRLAEVVDFVEFLAARDAKAQAANRLGEALSKLDSTLGQPFTDEEIEAEISAARQERLRVQG
jgi:hypothetical protein